MERRMYQLDTELQPGLAAKRPDHGFVPSIELTAFALRLLALHHRRGVRLVRFNLDVDHVVSEFAATAQQARTLHLGASSMLGVRATRLHTPDAAVMVEPKKPPEYCEERV